MPPIRLYSIRGMRVMIKLWGLHPELALTAKGQKLSDALSVLHAEAEFLTLIRDRLPVSPSEAWTTAWIDLQNDIDEWAPTLSSAEATRIWGSKFKRRELPSDWLTQKADASTLEAPEDDDDDEEDTRFADTMVKSFLDGDILDADVCSLMIQACARSAMRAIVAWCRVPRIYGDLDRESIELGMVFEGLKIDGSVLSIEAWWDLYQSEWNW